MNSSKMSEHVLDTMHPNWFCPWGPFCCKVLSFLPSYKIHERVLSMAKMHRIKKQHHFEKATLWDLQLCFVHFSSHVKCFTRICATFHVRAKMPKPKTRYILRAIKVKRCRSQKFAFQSNVGFFDLMHFVHRNGLYMQEGTTRGLIKVRSFKVWMYSISL